MNEARNAHIRKQAIDAVELLKGFTPEQREQFSSAVYTVEEFSGYLLELTSGDSVKEGYNQAIDEIKAITSQAILKPDFLDKLEKLRKP